MKIVLWVFVIRSFHLLYIERSEINFAWFQPVSTPWFRSSWWNVSQGKQQKPVKKSLLVWWLLSWDRQRRHCLAGIEEVRDQQEVLQRRVVDDTSILHLKPGRENGKSRTEYAVLNILKVSINHRTLQLNPFLPVSRGYDIVYRGWRGVSGGAEGLSQTVGPRLGENEPVSDVELRQQAVVHYLIQVIPWGAPQAAAEHGSIQGRGLTEQMVFFYVSKTQ